MTEPEAPATNDSDEPCETLNDYDCDDLDDYDTRIYKYGPVY